MVFRLVWVAIALSIPIEGRCQSVRFECVGTIRGDSFDSTVRYGKHIPQGNLFWEVRYLGEDGRVVKVESSRDKVLGQKAPPDKQRLPLTALPPKRAYGNSRLATASHAQTGPENVTLKAGKVEPVPRRFSPKERPALTSN